MKAITLISLSITILALSIGETLAKDEDTISISPQEFTTKACESASDVDACHSIVKTIIGSNPRDEDLDASKVAHEAAKQVQARYSEVADDLQDLLKENKDAKKKDAYSKCYKMYLDNAHDMRETIGHLKKDNEVCKARDFASSADANPKFCEEELVKAGTTGEKLGLYKNFNDLQDLAGACDSIIAYMIQSNKFKSGDCKKMW